MSFYELSKPEREKILKEMKKAIKHDLKTNTFERFRKYASNNDTYIRKNAYLIVGRLYRDLKDMRGTILNALEELFKDEDEKVRQTVVYALGEIGKIDAHKIVWMLKMALNDEHHSVRNALVGTLKQMGEKNPKPTLEFAKKFLHHIDPKIRRVILHGIELRGRKHPEDVLPFLAELQNDPDKRVREMIIHVLSQISYKKGCLEKVVSALKSWENKELVEKALRKILDVHERYEKFSVKSYEEAEEYLRRSLNP